MAYDLHSTYIFISFFIFFFTSCTYAYQFRVGGKNGWISSPSEKYNHWAERMRFQVNDTLLFKYKRGWDSLLVVNQDDYEKCSSSNPIFKLNDGDSIFKFDRSGPFFFISGKKSNCDKGQKLVVIVLAIRRDPYGLLPPAESPSALSPSIGNTPAVVDEIGGGSAPEHSFAPQEFSTSDFLVCAVSLVSTATIALVGL